jgi:hypothetical protein
MKVSIKELRGAIQMIIKEEIGKVLPRMLAEALADKYISKALAEVVSQTVRRPVETSRPKSAPAAKHPHSLQDLMGESEENDPTAEWEEEIPSAMPNQHKGIYNQSPLMRGKTGMSGPTNESRKALLRQVYDGDPEEILQDPRLEAQERSRRNQAEEASYKPVGMEDMFEGTRPLAESASSAMGLSQQQFGEEGVPLDFLDKIGVNFNTVKKAVAGPAGLNEKVDDARLKQLEMQRKRLDVRG